MPPKAGQLNHFRFTMYLRESRSHANIIAGAALRGRPFTLTMGLIRKIRGGHGVPPLQNRACGVTIVRLTIALGA